MPPPPPIPTEPVRLRMDAFELGPGGEVFLCQNFANPFGQDVNLLVSESFMTPGSHHLFAFNLEHAVAGPLEECAGLEFHPYIHSAQAPHHKTTYPAGVGRFFSGAHGVRLMVHYLNPSPDVIHPNVELALTAVGPAAVSTHAAHLFLNNLGVSVPPHSRVSVTHSCRMRNNIQLIVGSSHMHQRGVRFQATTDDGRVIYQAEDWAEPAPATFEPPFFIEAGSSINWTCDYENPTDKTFTFGQSAQDNEMCIFTGVFFPAPDGYGISCH